MAAVVKVIARKEIGCSRKKQSQNNGSNNNFLWLFPLGLNRKKLLDHKNLSASPASSVNP